MKLIVGLGNPGTRYSGTRHNAGRAVIEFLACRNALSFSKKKSLKASVASWEGNEAILAIPEVYMNQSGAALLALIKHFELNVKKDLLIAVDDAALPFGRLRLRSKGSDGGHNGLKSVQEALGSSDYPRLRLGIANGEMAMKPLEEFVLLPFNPEEEKAIPLFLERGAEACKLWLTQPMTLAMNVINDSRK